MLISLNHEINASYGVREKISASLIQVYAISLVLFGDFFGANAQKKQNNYLVEIYKYFASRTEQNIKSL